MTPQGRHAFKNASRAYCPYLYCIILAAGGKLAAVVVPCDGPDPTPVPGQRAPALPGARFRIPQTDRAVTAA